MIKTGQVNGPDQLIAVFVALAHFILIGACLLGVARIIPKATANVLRFIGGGVVAIAYFAAIILLFGKRYTPLLRRGFGV